MKHWFSEKISRNMVVPFLGGVFVVLACLFLKAPVSATAEALISLQPIDIPSEKLLPGMDVRIIEKFFRNINEMPDDTSFSKTRPFPNLAFRYEGGTPMFHTDRSLAIGMSIRGYLHIDQPGIYEFQARSNDGIRMKLTDIVILEDPDVHSNRLSPVARCTIQKSGYLPLHILYFQRKGSACLELYWKRPGSNTFEIIPEKAYWRAKES
ncbi:MAG: PA14 domain-containing protein [Thermodesulfobacteriota bacterium]